MPDSIGWETRVTPRAGAIKKPLWARAASNGAVEEFSRLWGGETLHIGGKNGQIVKVSASPRHFTVSGTTDDANE